LIRNTFRFSKTVRRHAGENGEERGRPDGEDDGLHRDAVFLGERLGHERVLHQKLREREKPDADAPPKTNL
jgi:hypothetical protein